MLNVGWRLVGIGGLARGQVGMCVYVCRQLVAVSRSGYASYMWYAVGWVSEGGRRDGVGIDVQAARLLTFQPVTCPSNRPCGLAVVYE